jgi:hypothetical protein
MAVRAGQEPVFRRQREPDRVVETRIVRPLHEVLDNSQIHQTTSPRLSWFVYRRIASWTDRALLG